MSVKQSELAKLWGVTKGRVSQMVKAGMPLDSAAVADAWRAANCGGAGSKIFSTTTTEAGARGETTAEQLPAPPVPPSTADLERSDVHGVAARCIQAELEAWKGYALAIQSQDLTLIAARGRLYRDAAETRIRAEKSVLELRRAAGETVTLAEAKEFVAKTLEQVALALRQLPASIAHRANPADPQLARAAALGEVTRIFEMMKRAQG